MPTASSAPAGCPRATSASRWGSSSARRWPGRWSCRGCRRRARSAIVRSFAPAGSKSPVPSAAGARWCGDDGPRPSLGLGAEPDGGAALVHGSARVAANGGVRVPAHRGRDPVPGATRGGVEEITMWRRVFGGVMLVMILSGCAAISAMSLAVDAITGGVGIYQRYEDRQAQRDQTEALRELKAAVDATKAEMVRLRSLMEQAEQARRGKP